MQHPFENNSKRLLIALLLCMLLPLGQAWGQTYEWAHTFGSSSFDLSDDIATDPAGNVYVAGTFYNTVDFDPSAATANLTAVNHYDAYFAKFSPAGALIWVKQIGGTDAESISQINIASDGSIYLTGAFESTTDFDPGAGTFNLTSAGSYDGFLMKLDSSGSFLWAIPVGASSLSDFANDVDFDAQGNLVVVGSFQGTSDMDPSGATANFTSLGSTDIFVAEYNSNGQYQWCKTTGGSNLDIGRRLRVDPMGDLVISGEFRDTADFDPGTGISNLTANGNSDIFVLKLNSTGDFVWAKSFGSTGSPSDYLHGMAVGQNGEVYTTGTFQTSGDFDPGSGTSTLTAVGSNDVFVQKLNAAGNFEWAYNVGGSVEDEGFGVTVDGNGDVYVSGYVAGMVDMDPGAGVNMVNGGGTGDLFIQKLDPSGNLQWVISSFGSSSCLASQMAIGNNGDIFTVGWFTGTVDFDPSASTANRSSNGSIDAFLARYSQANFCLPTSSTINPTACGSYTSPSGQVLSSTGSYLDTIPNTGGCDSIITINLEVNQSSASSIAVSQCGGTYTTPSGQVLNASGLYSDTIPNAAGCDSIIGIDLTINQTSSSTISPTLCNSDYVSPSGILLVNSGIYTDTIPNAVGCDSSIIINLTINRVTAAFSQSGPTLIALSFGGTYQWIDCDNGPIAGATASTFTPSQTGNYAVIMSENGCTDTSACQNIVVVGLEVSSQGFAQVWPNPNQGDFHLSLDGFLGEVEVSIFNAQGQELQRRMLDADSAHQLTIPGAAGIYFLRISQGGRHQSLRMIKNQ